ncbi:hypothetical protein G6F32_014440 [Rhizopus arrhizus]|nr:hypothetical protein G6F32_014440 [Rhizopus arrhizus]
MAACGRSRSATTTLWAGVLRSACPELMDALVGISQRLLETGNCYVISCHAERTSYVASPSSPRLASIDQRRGTGMLLMLLDHVRETFFLQHQVGDPMDAASVSPALPVGVAVWPAPGRPAPRDRRLPAQARPVPGGAGTDAGQLRLTLPVPAGHAVPAGDLGHWPEHDRAGRPAVAAAPGAAGAGRAAGGRP